MYKASAEDQKVTNVFGKERLSGLPKSLELGFDLEARDGEILWDESNSYIPMAQIQKGASPTWTGLHTFNGGLETGTLSIEANNSDVLLANLPFPFFVSLTLFDPSNLHIRDFPSW